ncbi:hypothetical protein FG379_000628 [Cryptosporidium bovis]|uniref:uncharacterized protein n=1 Tax=Cryptosporidium bovis TaxID=310047 RepID=UPI003519E80C|nr:hypothetical protein FG379_000628 [Cryptosporidium bovis]
MSLEVIISKSCRKVRVLCILLFLTLFTISIRESYCSVTGSIIEAVKRQRNRLKPYEERKPKLGCQDSISPYVKRQLYWYYKNLVAQKEINKIWNKGEKFSVDNITDDSIFLSEFLLPTSSDTLKFGKFLDSGKKEEINGTEKLYVDYSTPLLYNVSQLRQGLTGIVLDGMVGKQIKVEINDFGRILDRNETDIKSVDNSGTKSDFSHNSNYIWGTLVSPCDGQVQFNLALDNSTQYEENVSLYIVYCDSGGVRERYSKFGGRVTEFLNGRYGVRNFKENECVYKEMSHEKNNGYVFRKEKNSVNKNTIIDLKKRYNVNRGDVLMKIVEYYNPPIFEEDLTIIPIFMPCEGTIAWDKKQKHIFTKGERILEFRCHGETKIRQLISPGRGYTEFVNEEDKRIMGLIESIKSQGFPGGYLSNGDELELDSTNKLSTRTIPIGYLIGLMKLEVNYGKKYEKNIHKFDDEPILVKMPCIGKVEYPILKDNFMLRDEVS